MFICQFLIKLTGCLSLFHERTNGK
jgi:hypothetical protein